MDLLVTGNLSLRDLVDRWRLHPATVRLCLLKAPYRLKMLSLRLGAVNVIKHVAVLISLLAGLTSTLRTRASLQVEILALRHQPVVLQRNRQKRVSLRAWDRLLWVALVRLWPE